MGIQAYLLYTWECSRERPAAIRGLQGGESQWTVTEIPETGSRQRNASNRIVG